MVQFISNLKNSFMYVQLYAHYTSIEIFTTYMLVSALEIGDICKNCLCRVKHSL